MKTVNSGNSLQPFPLNNPPVFSQIALTGTNACKGTFASEFGGVAISSFESLSPTLDSSHWALHANPMSERNYAVDNFVTAIANLTWPDAFNTTGELNFKGMLYFAMLSQALWVKSDIESRRTQNNFGIITWQVSERKNEKAHHQIFIFFSNLLLFYLNSSTRFGQQVSFLS
jgi:hypothetical protein